MTNIESTFLSISIILLCLLIVANMFECGRLKERIEVLETKINLIQ